MSRSEVIFAPAGVQLNRAALTIYALVFGSFVWTFRFSGSPEGLLVIGGFAGISVLALSYTFIRTPWSRWLIAGATVVVPASWFAVMCWLVWSRPTAWWDWALCGLLTLALASIPGYLALPFHRPEDS
jgi:hypothetical protein